MKASEIDWGVLRGAIILLALSLLVGVAALATSPQFWSKQEAGLKRERSRLLAARGHYHALDDEEDIIATYLPRYLALEEQGLIGREQRLDWIDALREAAREAKVPQLEYVIDAQRPFDTGMELNVGDYRVYASSMRLQLGLSHEGDLLRLLDALRTDVAGLFGVNGCRIARRNRELVMAPDARNLDAQCVLNFITVRRLDNVAGVGQ